VQVLVLCLTSFAVCAAGALIPLINTEVYLIGAAALTPRALWVPLVLAGTVGAMAGKVLLYFAGRGVVRLPRGRVKAGLERVQARMEGRPRTAALLYLASATAGVPPFYLTTIAAGAVEMNFAFFLIAGFAGRLLRFGVVVMIPDLASRIFG
jgi:membrane protein YqaA with SNARE-associated domain